MLIIRLLKNTAEMYNSRGQNIDYVKKSVEDNLRFEGILKNHIKKKYDIDLIKSKNPYKHYDFSYNKIIKVEYKGLYYALKDVDKIAVSVKNPDKKIKDVFISKSKIAYYKIRQIKNPSLRFYLVYGFYEIDNDEIKQIIYRYLNISDLENMILNFKSVVYENAKHYIIPIKDLVKLPKENLFNI